MLFNVLYNLLMQKLLYRVHDLVVLYKMILNKVFNCLQSLSFKQTCKMFMCLFLIHVNII